MTTIDTETLPADAHTAMTPLRGRRVLITGGTTGIGRAIARLLALEGAEVFIFGRHAAELKDALASIRETGGDAQGTTADVALEEDVHRVFELAQEQLGGIDVLVANAGISGEGVADMAQADWRYVLETNLAGYLACAHAAVKAMRGTGGGHIVFIGSVSADAPDEGASSYVATKAGIQGFAESFGREVAKDRIKVSLIEPGSTGASLQDDDTSKQRKRILRNEMLRAEDIAVACHYVLSQPERCVVNRLVVNPLVQVEE
jgi:NADP-dependent 3-hydroxy acid dehydrogenase YdfG